MNFKKILLVSLALCLMVGTVVLADTIINHFNGNATITQNAGDGEMDADINIGASPGPDHYFRQDFLAGFNMGGTVWASTTEHAAETLSVLDVDGDVEYWQIVPNVNLSLTMMATGSMSNFLGTNIGAKREIILHNASTTTASTITLVAGTGMDLQEDEAETVVVNGLEFARLTFLRTGLQLPAGGASIAGDSVMLWVEVSQVGD